MRAFDVEMSRRGFASALAAGALSLALAGCGGGTAGAGSAAGSAAGKAAAAAAEPVEVHVASLKGPTSIGLVQFMDQAASGETDNEFDFAISAAADEIVPKVIQGDIDIALNDLGHDLVGRGADRKVELVIRLAARCLVHKLHQTDRRRALERGDVYLDGLRGGRGGLPSSRARGGPGTGSPAATASQRKRQRARGERRGKPPARHLNIKRAHR